jgi:hypothetical protein
VVGFDLMAPPVTQTYVSTQEATEAELDGGGEMTEFRAAQYLRMAEQAKPGRS